MIEKENTSGIQQFSKINWYILGGGVAVVASVSGGFGIYALALIIIGLLTSCICPCIGLGIAGASAGIWTLLVLINIYIGVFTLGVVSILSPIGLIISLFQKNKNGGVIFSFILQLLISWIGLYYVYPLIEVFNSSN
tara:strand:+ start:12506 stop:12916 length:411 start_codon:yes stop_codon:yes gene_type:complete